MGGLTFVAPSNDMCDLNDLLTPLFLRYNLASTTLNIREPHVNWYTQGRNDHWIASVYPNFVEVRDHLEDDAIVTSHDLNAADPEFLVRLESDLKAIIEWLKQ